MSYTDKHLMTGEYVIYRARLHWIVFKMPIFWLALSVWFMWHGGRDLNDTMGPIGLLILIFLAIPTGIGALIRKMTSEFAVTNKRVLIKFGLIRRKSLETLLVKIEGIQVDQGIIGRILQYGAITVGGTGGTKEPCYGIAKPLEFRRQVQEQIAESDTRASTKVV